MKLVSDDFKQVYYWEDDETSKCLSPCFDYEEDAIQWYGRISKQILSEFGIEKDLL